MATSQESPAAVKHAQSLLFLHAAEVALGASIMCFAPLAEAHIDSVLAVQSSTSCQDPEGNQRCHNTSPGKFYMWGVGLTEALASVVIADGVLRVRRDLRDLDILQVRPVKPQRWSIINRLYPSLIPAQLQSANALDNEVVIKLPKAAARKTAV